MVTLVAAAAAQTTNTCYDVNNMAQQATCQSTDGNSYRFDLSCVEPPSNELYFAGKSIDGQDYWYYFNFQSPGLPNSQFAQCQSPDFPWTSSDTIVAAQASGDGQFCYGLADQYSGTWELISNIGSSEFLRVSFNHDGRNLEVDMICDPTATTPAYEPQGENTDRNVYEITIQTKWACKQFADGKSCNGAVTPGKERGGPGGALFGIFCGLCVIYFGGGYAFLRYKKEAPEGERFIHKEFWSSIPGLVKEGISFSKAKVFSGGSSSEPYQSV